MLTRNFIFTVLLSFTFFPKVSLAQIKDIPVKDTVAFLTSFFNSSTGKLLYFENGKINNQNQYFTTDFEIKDCEITSTVKLIVTNSKGVITNKYTLYYKIPLSQIDEITTETKKDTSVQHIGTPLFLASKNRKYVIHYKMIEDHTERIEADDYYNESTLWCTNVQCMQVIKLLRDLCQKCTVK